MPFLVNFLILFREDVELDAQVDSSEMENKAKKDIKNQGYDEEIGIDGNNSLQNSLNNSLNSLDYRDKDNTDNQSFEKIELDEHKEEENSKWMILYVSKSFFSDF